jgi:hypothetical protein
MNVVRHNGLFKISHEDVTFLMNADLGEREETLPVRQEESRNFD